ncbi:MAG: hypothetical protein ACTSQJ_12415 [Promethearchaeota archaeon]
MRIRRRSDLKKKNLVIIFLFLLPIIGFLTYASVLLYMLYDISKFTLEMDPPDTKYFYNMEEIDMNKLDEMANRFDWQLERWHIPTNMTVDVTFTDRTYSEVDHWHGTDNGNLHLGYTLAANCMRYKWALDNNDEILLENASRMIKKSVSALSDLMAAPNGGLGPEYPGTLARFVCPYKYKNIHPWIFEDNPRHFNGTGKYHNWRVRLYTSRDELGGFYLATASVLKFVNPKVNEESKWAVERVKLIVEQIIEGFRKKSNWLVLGGNGNPTGSDLNPLFEGSTWQLGILRIGASAVPEKYESLYRYCAAKMLSLNSAKMGDIWGSVSGYYAYSFGLDVLLSLIWLEDNPNLQTRYIQSFEEHFYPIVRYHRNAFFNIAHLMCMKLVNNPEQYENSEYSDKKIKWDVLDQLWRFWKSNWGYGIRNYNLTDRPHSTRSTSLNPDIRAKERVPAKKRWREFFNESIFGNLYSYIQEEFDFSVESEQYMLPLTVSEYEIHHWMWEHSKFTGEGGNPTGDGLTQAAPNSYIFVYWMGKAFDIF